MSKTTDELQAILDAPLPAPVDYRSAAKIGIKEHAALVRALFKRMGLRGMSVTAPRYTMASVTISLPWHDDGTPHVMDEQGRHEWRDVCPTCQLRREALEKLEQILYAASPNTGDRSDYMTDYFDNDYFIHG